MHQKPAWGIGRKLLTLVLVNAFAWAFVAGIVWVSFDRIEDLASAIADKEMAGVFDNATLGRDLSATLSEIDRVTRNCQTQDQGERYGEDVIARLSAVTHTVQDRGLAEAINTLTATTKRLLDQCHEISQTLIALDSSDSHLLDALTALENLTSRALIEQTLAGRNTDYLDQIMTLVVGYRETVLQIGREISRGAAAQPMSNRKADKVIRLIDDLRLRLQTMTASTPEMAKIARHMRLDAAQYRDQIILLYGAQGRFETLLAENRGSREAVLGLLKRLDLDAVNRSGHFSAELRELMAQTGRQVLWTSMAIALLSMLLALWFVRRDIQHPLGKVLQQIDGIRNGSPPVVAQRNDEWGTIQLALSEMSVDLARARDLLQQIIDTALIRVFWKDRDSRYLGCNPAFARDAGKQSPAEIIGQDDYAMGWAAQADRYRADDRHVMVSGQPRLGYEEPQTTPDNKQIWLRTSKVPLKNPQGETIGVLGIYDDITEHKRLEEQLIGARNAADASNRAKSEFLANMSHEIRTPLNGVLGMAQLLLLPDLKQDEREEYARIILNSGQTLLTLLNDILDLSKVEAGKLELKPSVFNPQQIVEDTAVLFSEAVRTKDLAMETRWHGPEGQRYLADPIRLRQMLSNLISNAIKFTAAGTIKVEAMEIESSGESVLLEFAVTDSGMGVPLEKQPLLFQPFSQVDGSSTRAFGGTGLGLSIVRSLARLMTGEVGVESAAGKGARFWFRIRAVIVAPDGESRHDNSRLAIVNELPTQSDKTPLVLIVEDNATNRKVVEALLKKRSVRTESVENGRLAVDLIMNGMRPDLVLMDVQMPVMGGIEATESIRRWERDTGQPGLTIVALTAGAFEEDRNNCIAAGMDDFLTKPINVGELQALLSKWLRR